MPEILLIRHCESTGQAADAPLTPRGREQALALADRLAVQSIDHVVSSPYARARATIAPLAARLGLHTHVDERLRERQLSAEPTPRWRELVERSFSDPDHRLPGGESAAEVLARGRAAIHAALASGHRLPVVVTHGQLLSLFLHSIDAAFGYGGWASLANPDVFLLRHDGKRFSYFRLPDRSRR